MIRYKERQPGAVAKLELSGEHQTLYRLAITEELHDAIEQSTPGQALVLTVRSKAALMLSLSETCSCLTAVLGGKVPIPEEPT